MLYVVSRGLLAACCLLLCFGLALPVGEYGPVAATRGLLNECAGYEVPRRGLCLRRVSLVPNLTTSPQVKKLIAVGPVQVYWAQLSQKMIDLVSSFVS